MANFIFLQPSCDIHLVRDPAFKRNGNSLNNLKLTVFAGEFQGLEPTAPRFSRNFKIDPVPPADVICEFYPAGQNFVAYDAATGELRRSLIGLWVIEALA